MKEFYNVCWIVLILLLEKSRQAFIWKGFQMLACLLDLQKKAVFAF